MEFTYKAIKNNQTVNGVIEAESEDKALTYLRASNITILNIQNKSKPVMSSLGGLFSKVAFSDIVDFTRQLSIMLNSGLTLIDSLDILKRQTQKTAYTKLIYDIDDDVRAGNSLSMALKNQKGLFNNLYIALVKAGEASGKLDDILNKLSSNLEQQRAFRGKIKGAMVYPAIVMSAMGGVMFVMVSFVIPKLLEVYKDFNVKLPAPTVFLIALSNFFQHFWFLVIIGFVAGVVALRRYYRSRIGKLTIDRVMLKLPLISRIIKISALVDTTRTLSILVGAGVSILEALDIITETTTNIVYQNALKDVKISIEKGETLGKSLDEAGIFPPIFVQMTAVGEQTGHLDDTLGHLAAYFESESEIAIKSLTTLIEPAILIVLGLGVGFVVIAVITPIFSLTSSFS
ncbi:hypothetical protein A3D06_01895 [Candidatus Roizmanbacteria bacterium RIFCSPHIGHO2_02_FULL_40_9]|uniref:Type II secretion system protein GspF domain-containing protein n=2 Tax=Candidatus Roizmaniibacteriota TaxID=1752723 RepID=A0A1F7INY0_9BACT|nr:MAG: hypothetical protein A3D06_01895 [Candidatus Roizmanbacteria bacterium RIFCSPHIGHO2_02_FULL_40_9]OGK45070.1 MAG: hypothetical protein A2957_02115 [Candidatus Roizmanbacteria bacterium RIFCSPLOWO2_01_FULL_38_11]